MNTDIDANFSPTTIKNKSLIQWLSCVQMKQDFGHSWSAAVEYADDNINI